MTTLHRDTTGDDDRATTLWGTEARFWAAGAAVYRDAFAPDGLAVVPGAILTHDDLVAMMVDSTPWGDVEVTEDRVVGLGADAAALVYRAVAARDDLDAPMTLLATSVYRRAGTAWQLTVHQQTVVPTDAAGG